MLLLLSSTLPIGARMVNAINGRTQLGCQCFLQSLRLELGAAPSTLFTSCLEVAFSGTQYHDGSMDYLVILLRKRCPH